MLLKTFILDSETKLTYGNGKDYSFCKAGRERYSGERAVEATQSWIDEFKVRYPGYATKMQDHFDNFIGK